MEFALYRFLSRLPLMGGEHIPIRRHRLTGLDICDVTTDELDDIERTAGDLGLDFQIAQFCLAVALSFLAAVLSSPPNSDRVNTVFVVIIVVGFALGAIFGFKWFKQRGDFSRCIQKIRDRKIGPMGQEGHELRPAEIAKLPPAQAPEAQPGEVSVQEVPASVPTEPASS